MTDQISLGLDIGGTASRWVACSANGDVLARGQAAGATAHVFNPAELVRLRAALETVARDVTAAGLTISTVSAGMTGYGSTVSVEIKNLISTAFNLDAASILVMDDIILGYVSQFAPGEGHLISAGTGSIGLHVGGTGQMVRVGGRGILIDDGGSGSWIALQALDRMYRALDHDGSFAGLDRLAHHMFASIGGASWNDVRHFVYAGDRGRIGTLAVAVARAAEEGDVVAVDILTRAGDELAGLAQALIARCGRHPVRLVGGVLRLHPAIFARVRNVLSDFDVALVETDAALAAARLSGTKQSGWRDLLATQSSLA
jgi:N-acetylglucosamine kinase-like BadF-type ATPase